MTFQPIICWTEIAVSDLEKSIEFYNAVFQWDMSAVQMGLNKTAVFGGQDEAAGGHLYEGKPSTDGCGTTVHITVKDTLENAMERCKAAGGTLVGEPVDIPPGRFAYAIDLDGNSLGLFEPKG